MTDKLIETIINGLEPIALVIRSEFDAPGVQFFTPPSFSQQVAVMSHPQGKKIAPHIHNLVSRQVLYTQEVLLVRRGKVKVNLYSSEKQQIASLTLKTGDVILLCGGGHSFEMLEDASLLEVKQGPYAGENDKTIFQES